MTQPEPITPLMMQADDHVVVQCRLSAERLPWAAAAATLPAVWVTLLSASRLSRQASADVGVRGAGSGLVLLFVAAGFALTGAGVLAGATGFRPPIPHLALAATPLLTVTLLPASSAYHHQLLIVGAGLVTAQLAWLVASWSGVRAAARQAIRGVVLAPIVGFLAFVIGGTLVIATGKFAVGLVVGASLGHALVLVLSSRLAPRADERQCTGER